MVEGLVLRSVTKDVEKAWLKRCGGKVAVTCFSPVVAESLRVVVVVCSSLVGG